MINRLKPRTAEIGIFGVAHGTYWGQFPGLYENICKYHNDLINKIKKYDVSVTDYGIIDSNEDAYKALDKINAQMPDVLLCNMTTYATSSVFAPIIRNTDIPIVLVALQPLEALDYNKACTFMQLENDNICSVPEFTGVAIRMGKKVSDVIIGCLYGDDEAALKEWCEVAKVLHALKGARFGLMGHVLESMYDMHADPTAVSAGFNVHVPLLEIDDLIELCSTVNENEIREKIELIRQEFDMPDVKKSIIDFWKLFRKECPDIRVETRDTNLSTGIDYATDGVALGEIYDGGFNILPPPNSPWAAINGNFGLEIMGYLSRIAELPDKDYLCRYYIHDPWWANSPWLDRYGRNPHDIYLPMSLVRINENGEVHAPNL